VIQHRNVRANGIDLHVVEAGEGPLVVLCHGFPELWYSWRHQLPALAEAGYRVVAPDQRGYGGSDKPGAIDEYDIEHLAADMLGLLDALGEERAVFAGHDWGAPVVWHLALTAPERLAGVVGLSVPFMPRLPMRPTEMFSALAGDNFFYILYFQEPGVADENLGRDPERTLRNFLWTISGDAPLDAWKVLPKGATFMDSLSEPDALPAWLSADDLAFYTAEFRRTGFTGGLNWYRNFDRNWEITERLADRKVEVPALFVAGDRDPVIRMSPPDVMDDWVPDLRGKTILPGAGHWIQQERPAEVNAALLEFLAGLNR
jgi:pimeloyl-ACP methyl ester carboxylesterase